MFQLCRGSLEHGRGFLERRDPLLKAFQESGIQCGVAAHRSFKYMARSPAYDMDRINRGTLFNPFRTRSSVRRHVHFIKVPLFGVQQEVEGLGMGRGMKASPRGLLRKNFTRCQVEDPGATEDSAEQAASPFFCLLLGDHAPFIHYYGVSFTMLSL